MQFTGGWFFLWFVFGWGGGGVSLRNLEKFLLFRGGLTELAACITWSSMHYKRKYFNTHGRENFPKINQTESQKVQNGGISWLAQILRGLM